MGSFLYCRPSDIITDQATVSLTVGTVNASYPLVNLQDRLPAKPCKTTGTAATFRFTFGGAVTLEMISLGPHNLAGATVALTNGAGMASQAITIPANREDGLSVNPFKDFSAVGSRTSTTWDLAITGAAAPIAIGEVQLVTTKRTLLVEWGLKEGERHVTVGRMTDYGSRMTYWLGVSQRRLLAHVGLESERAAILSLIRDARGLAKAFLIIPDSSVNDAWLADLTTDERLIERNFLFESGVDLEFLETQRGVAL